MDRLTPTYMFEAFHCVTPQFLLEHGIRALLIDIDNRIKPSTTIEESADEVVKAAADSVQTEVVKKAE